MKKITLMLALSFIAATANAIPTDNTYALPNFAACSENEELCTEVARYKHYAIVRQPLADCPAGAFYLVNNVRLEIIGLDAETCSPNVEWKFQNVGDDATPKAVMYLEGKPFRMYSL